MGLKSEVRLALELYKKNFFNDIKKVLDLGSQDILLTYDQFKFYLYQSGLEFDSKDFDHLKSFPNKKGFSSKYLWNLLGIKNYQISDRLFDIFDKDNNGSIDYDEFMNAIKSMVDANHREKVEFAFELHDLDNSGFIDRHELKTLIQQSFLENHLD